MSITRRKFLIRTLRTAVAAGFGSLAISGCTGIRVAKRSLDETLRRDTYERLTENWDPIYGPPIQSFSRYGGPGDFQGHIRGDAVPGLDYDVPMGTPLVPMMASYLRQATTDPNGAIYLLLVDIFHPAYRISLAHLDSILVDERFLLSGDVMKYLGRGVRSLGREEMVALSGNSGSGPREYGWVQPPHLHLSLYYLNFGSNTFAYLDPEKFGPDGGRPVFWDGETILDGEPEKRLFRLEQTLEGFKRELDLWPETPGSGELGGLLMESCHRLGGVKGRRVLDSKHFHDMRALLKRMVLEEKRYLPGTKPYSMMLKILGYSTQEEQKVILTLPFIAPGLLKIYKKPRYEDGTFFNLLPVEKPSKNAKE